MKARLSPAAVLPFLLLALFSAALPAAAQAPLDPGPFALPGPYRSNLDPWDDPWEFPIGPDAIDERDRSRERLEFWTDFLGEPPPALQPHAAAVADVLLQGCAPDAARALLADAFPSLSPDDAPSAVSSLPPSWAYAYALILLNAGQSAPATAVWHLVASEPPPSGDWRDLMAAALAADKYLGQTAGNRAHASRRAAVRPLAARNAAAAIVRLQPEGPAARFLRDRLHASNLAVMPEEGGLWPFLAELDALGVTNALACALHADCEILWAWKCRGAGFASTVTDEGWQGFSDHLDAADAWALKALALDPSWAAPYEPLLQSAGAGHYRGATPLELARRAFLLESDRLEILDNLLHFLRPRWHCGAGDALRALRGVLAIPRHDIRTPFHAVDLLDTLRNDQACYPSSYATAGHPLPLHADPALWPAFRAMFEAYLACPDSAIDRDFLLRVYLRTAHRFHDPAPALAAWDAAGCPPLFAENIDPEGDLLLAVGRLGIAGLRAEAFLDAAAPRARADLFSALFFRDRDAAQAALSALRTAVPAHAPPGSAVLRLLARMERDFAIVFDWEPEPGWTDVHDRTLFRRYRYIHPDAWAIHDASGFRIRAASPCNPSFRVRREDDSDPAYCDLSADIAADPGAPGDRLPAVALAFHATDDFAAGIQYDLSTGALAAFVSEPADASSCLFFEHHSGTPPDPGTPVRLRLAVRDARLSAWLDGQPVFDAIPIPEGRSFDRNHDTPPQPFPADAPLRPAISIPWLTPGPSVWIDRIRFRLSSPSPAPEESDLPSVP